MNDRNDTLSSRVLCLVVSISDMHTKKEEERKEKGKIRENGDTLENHKGNVRKARERERERGKERKESIFRTLVAFNLASFLGKLICGHA